MPEPVMTSMPTTVTCTDVTRRIEDLKERMDSADQSPPQTDSDGSSKPSLDMNIFSKETRDNIKSEQRIVQSLKLTNGLVDRKVPLNLYQSKKGELKQTQFFVRRTTPRSEGEPEMDATHSRGNVLSVENGGNYEVIDDRTSETVNVANDTRVTVSSVDGQHQTITECENVPSISTARMASKTKTDVDIDSRLSSVSRHSKSVSLDCLLADDTLPPECKFDKETLELGTKALLNSAEPCTDCLCSISMPYLDTLGFSGWDAPHNGVRVEPKRKCTAVPKPFSSEAVFNRLTQPPGTAPARFGDRDRDRMAFRHHTDITKYIERYRYYHTVGNVGRPQAYSRLVDSTRDDPYYSKMRSNVRAMQSPSMFVYDNATQQLREKYNSSACSIYTPRDMTPRGHRRLDEEDDEEDADEFCNFDAQHNVTRERMKTLNLAPVRECTVPTLKSAEKIDIRQLNHYLNLATPISCQTTIEGEESVARTSSRSKTAGNTVEGNVSVTPSTPQRKGRSLRLGSAEFVKPGCELSSEKTNEKRAFQRWATITTVMPVGSTVPGNLIVGSTVASQTAANLARGKTAYPTTRASIMSPCIHMNRSGDNFTFTQNQTYRSTTPPHHVGVSGQKFKAYNRLLDLSSAAAVRDRLPGKFSYTHGSNEHLVPVVRTATVLDLHAAYKSRERVKKVPLDVKHLGVRGTTVKHSEGIVLLKNKRATALRS